MNADNTIDQAVAEQPDWQAHFRELNLPGEDGYLDKAEEVFEKAISNKAPVDLTVRVCSKFGVFRIRMI